MTTYNDWIEKTWRRVYSGANDSIVQLATAITPTTTSFAVTPAQATVMRNGAILSVDLEVLLVVNWNQNNGTATVVRGYEGSVPCAHAADALVYVQPKYSKFDIGVALNDELKRLSSPDLGLFQVGVSTVTYNPVYMGYDLGTIPTDFIDVLEIRHKIPFPTRNYPKISKWKVLRSIPDATVFPSGAGIVIYEGGYPGQPFYIQYSAPFTPLGNILNNDSSLNLSATLAQDVATVSGMLNPATDIPPLGAEIQLTLPKEIKRNFMESQPDPRKALEVLAGNVSNSVQALTILYNERVGEEAARLQRQYTRTEGW
jgi:hypothetical protein